MGSAGTKLNVYLEREFVFSFLNRYESKEDFFSTSFKAKIFDAEKNEIRSFDNRIYDKGSFNSAIAKLKNIKDRNYLFNESNKKVSIKQISDLRFEVENPTSLFLLEQASDENEKVTDATGLLFLNSEQIKDGFLKLCLNNDDFDSSKIISVNADKGDSFDFKQLKDYFIPNDSAIIMEPYLTSWTLHKIRDNLIPLIENLLLNKNHSKPVKVIIVSNYDKPIDETIWVATAERPNDFLKDDYDFIDPPAPSKSRYSLYQKAATIVETRNMLTNYFKENINLKILYAKEYLLKKKSRKEFESLNLRWDSDYIQLNKYLINNIHDRYLFTNYLYGKTGRSFDFNIEWDIKKRKNIWTSPTDLTLFSLIKSDHLETISKWKKIIEELFAFSVNRKFSKLFEFEES